MATKTPNIELDKLDLIDLVNRSKFNSNYDKIDAAIGQDKADIAELKAKTADLTELAETVAGIKTEVAGLSTEVGELTAEVADKADKDYVDTNFYTKTQADAKFLLASALKDTRVVTFTGSGIEIPYLWDGTAKQIKLSCKEALSASFVFQVERQAKADYVAKAANWEKVGATTLSLAAGSVYLEQTVTHAIHAGDILSYTTTATNDTGVTVQLIVENTITI